jgi:hypothetical protein
LNEAGQSDVAPGTCLNLIFGDFARIPAAKATKKRGFWVAAANSNFRENSIQKSTRSFGASR